MTPCSTGSLFICLCIINSWARKKNWEIPRSHARNSRKTLRKQSTKFCFSLLFSRIHKALSEKRKLVKCFLSNSFYKRLGPLKKRARVGHASCKVIYIVATEQSSFDETPGEGTFPGWISLISNFSIWKPWYELFWFRFWSVLYERCYISKYYWNDVEKTATLVKLIVKVLRHNSISRRNYSLSNTSHAHFRGFLITGLFPIVNMLIFDCIMWDNIYQFLKTGTNLILGFFSSKLVLGNEGED